MTWARYRKTQETEMRPYVPGEDMTRISVAFGTVPRLGGFIARDPLNRDDQWYVSPEYLQANYERVP